MERLGFVGLGAMGYPMARQLLRAGYPVTAYDLDQAAREKIGLAGATLASNLKEVGNSSMVFLLVANEKILSEVLLGDEGLLQAMPAGGVVVDMGTSTPARCRELATEANKRSIDFLDAPVSGSLPWASTGNLAIMVGGNKNTFDRCHPYFQTMGKKIFHLGPVGAGQSAKLCHQLGFLSLLIALGEAFALGKRAGIDPAQLVDVLDACASPSHIFEFLAPSIRSGNFANHSGGMSLGEKDLQAVLNLAQECSLQLPLAQMVHSFFAKAINSGHAMDDLLNTMRFAEEELFVE